jgi:N-dimethylarginine dimethylaminohydrolase
MGDALWHGTKKLLWGGHGFRTSLQVYETIAKTWDVPIITLELLDPDFYHIDTCLAVLDDDTVLAYPGAFTPEGQDIIRHMFKRVVEAPENEARRNMACNAFCPDAKNVVIQAGSPETCAKLKQAGFNVIEVDTTEFMKGGGSVFCMKMLTW